MGKTKWYLALVVVIVIGCGASTRGETRRGIVLAENGSPAKGAHVWAAKLWVHKLERVEATADDQGRFSVTLGPGQWLIEANLGDQGLRGSASIAGVRGPGAAAVDLRLTPQGRLRGRLVEAETGKPIVGGRLVIDNGLDPITDQDGRFEVGGLTGAVSRVVRRRAGTGAETCAVRDVGEAGDRPGDRRSPRGKGRRPRARFGRQADRRRIRGSIDLGLDLLADRPLDANRRSRPLRIRRPACSTARPGSMPRPKGSRAPSATASESDSGGGPAFGRIPACDAIPAAPRSRAGCAGRRFDQGGSPAKVANRRNVSGLVLDPGKKPVAGATVRWGSGSV